MPAIFTVFMELLLLKKDESEEVDACILCLHDRRAGNGYEEGADVNQKFIK